MTSFKYKFLRNSQFSRNQTLFLLNLTSSWFLMPFDEMKIQTRLAKAIRTKGVAADKISFSSRASEQRGTKSGRVSRYVQQAFRGQQQQVRRSPD